MSEITRRATRPFDQPPAFVCQAILTWSSILLTRKDREQSDSGPAVFHTTNNVNGPRNNRWAFASQDYSTISLTLGSHIVLVKKKMGHIRLCVDYRKLNTITKKDSFPLPRIDDILDMLTGPKLFSTIDLASWYWEIQMDEEWKEKTAFIVDNNVYEWNRLVFGRQVFKRPRDFSAINVLCVKKRFR